MERHHTAKEITWYATGKCTEPDKMQHPVDGRAWKNFDTQNCRDYRPLLQASREVQCESDGLWTVNDFPAELFVWVEWAWFNSMPTVMKITSSMRRSIQAQLARFGHACKEVKHLSYGGVKIKRNVLVELNWTKRSIFYELEYWSFLTLKHNLDIMHIEKNVLEAILNTLLMNDKSKYTAKARKELKRLGIRSGLWLSQNQKYGECSDAQQICSATLMEDDMLKAQSKVVDILCNLELIYPPVFFHIMIHLVIHLPLEALEGGPIHPRWMFPLKRFKKKLKGYVRNKAKPEGSIAEGYVAEEALAFSSHYFWDDTTKFNRPDRNIDPLPQRVNFRSSDPYVIRLVLRSVIRLMPRVEESDMIRQCHVDYDPGVSATSELFSLACGPTPTPISVNSCVVNDIIDIDEDDDIIDDEDALPYDLANSNDEDLVNVDDDGVDVVYSNVADVARAMAGKGTQKPNLGGRKAGRLHTRQETQNLRLKKITDDKGPVPIRFEWDDKKTMMPLGDHASHWSNYLGELIKEMPLYYPSWKKVPAKRKAAIVTKIGDRRTTWRASGTDVPRTLPRQIGMPRLPFGMIPGTKPEQLKIAKTGQKARSYAGRDPVTCSSSRSDDGELINSRVPVADPHLLRDTHWWRDVEAAKSRLQHRDGCALHRRRDHGHRSKGQAVRAPSRCWSDDKFSQMLTQFESSPEFGGASGSGDDEPGGDEDDDEDEKDGDS
ncbi:DIE2/ALG10 family protein [Tanacetum coccineum]